MNRALAKKWRSFQSFLHGVVVTGRLTLNLQSGATTQQVFEYLPVALLYEKQFAFVVDGQGGMNAKFNSTSRYLTGMVVFFQMVGVVTQEGQEVVVLIWDC